MTFLKGKSAKTRQIALFFVVLSISILSYFQLLSAYSRDEIEAEISIRHIDGKLEGLNERTLAIFSYAAIDIRDTNKSTVTGHIRICDANKTLKKHIKASRVFIDNASWHGELEVDALKNTKNP